MPVEVDWYVRHRVIRERYWGQVDRHDVDRHFEGVMALLAEAQEHAPANTVHLLVDARETSGSVPPLYLFVRQGVGPMRFKNRGDLFLVTRHQLLRTVAEITARIARFPLRVFESWDAAMAALEDLLASELL